jgi:molybdopterin converting factor small subunit
MNEANEFVAAGSTIPVPVHFYSYFKDVTGCAEAVESVPAGSTIGYLLLQLFGRFPSLAAMQNSMLVAVGVEYQPRSYVLEEGDVVSLFPPVQGG